MATIKYYIRNKKENSQIYLHLSLGKKNKFRRKTGQIINYKDWSKPKAYPKANTPANKNLITKLDKLKTYILEKVNTIDLQEITGEWLQLQIDLFFNRTTEHKKSEYVIDAIDNYINKAPTLKNAKGSFGLSDNRIKNLKGFKKIFLKFEKCTRKKYKVKHINFEFKDLFMDYLLNKEKYKKSFALKKLSDLKTVCFDAELYEIETSPQLKKIVAGKEKGELPQYLSFSEIERIKSLNIISKGLNNARKWLILGCSIGQRGDDLLNITIDNFIKRGNLLVIELKQKKTGKNVTIPVLNDTEKIYNSGLPYKISLQKFNDYIKELCRLAKINEIVETSKICMIDKKGNILEKDEKGRYKTKGIKRKIKGKYKKYEVMSSHTCRRSFATNNYGILPTALIMQITAHSTEKTFLQYIGKNALDYATQIADFYKLQELNNKKEPQLKLIKTVQNG